MSSASSHKFPKQRLSFKEKTKEDYKWGKDMIDQLCLNYASEYASHDSEHDISGRSPYARKLANYHLYNNIIDQKDFERECNALGIELGQFKDEVKPYNKTPNKIQVLLGEEVRRPFNHRPVLVNSEGIRTKKTHLTQELRSRLEAKVEELINVLRSRFQQPRSREEAQQIDQQIQEVMNELVDQDELKKLSLTSYLDAREIKASRILNYLHHSQTIREKMNDAFKHALLTGEEIVWVGIRNNEPLVEVVNPLGFFYDKSPEVKYIQDGSYAGYRTMMSSSDIIDRYGEYLTEKDLEKLEGPMQGINGVRDDLVGKDMKYHNVDLYYEYQSRLMNYSYQEGSYGRSSYGDHWLVTHVEWRSQKKVYFIKYVDETTGELVTDIANEDFTIPPGAQSVKKKRKYGQTKTIYQFDNYLIEEAWIPEVWEGVRIGEDIYCCIGPKEFQYRSIDNPRKVKLGYHGVIYNNMNADSVSLMDRMRPFQFLYFIVAHKLKQLIAKDKGQVIHIDLSMIPEQLGLEKTLYYLEHLDIDFFNPLQNAESPGAAQRGKITGATSRSNMQHIMNYIALLDAIDRQISDTAGITRQREGQTSHQQAVTTAQQDLEQSSTITEAVYFQPHFSLWREVLGSLLQAAQIAWSKDSVVKQYVLDDMSLEVLEMSPSELRDCDFGIFISDSGKDNEVFNTLKQLTQPLLQNDKAKMSDIIKLIKANSVQELQLQIEQSEAEFRNMQQQQLEAQQKQQQEQIQFEMQKIEDQQAHEKELEQMRIEAQLAIAAMKTRESGASEIDYEKLYLEQEKANRQAKMDEEKLKLEKEKIDQKERLENKKIAKQSSSSK